jgi:hypothetical protein
MMRISRSLLVAVASVVALSMASTPAWAANNNVAPNVVNALANATEYEYVRESMTVTNDGSYWLCAIEIDAPSNAFAFKYAALALSGASPVQTVQLSTSGGDCTDLVVDSDDNLYAGLEDRVAVYSSNSTGLATPIRTLTTASFNTGTMAMDTVNRLYVMNGEDVWAFDAGASGSGAPSRIIDGNDFGGSDLYVAAGADGTVYVADYDNDTIDVFLPTNNGPVWDREIVLTGYDAGSFGGIALNGDRIFVTYQDGTQAGIYVFPSSSDGDTEPTESWTGSNVVTSSDDALYDVGIGACSGELVAFEGYNDRIMTWTDLTTVCPEPELPNEQALANTGADSLALGGIAAGGLGLAVAGVVTLIAVRRRASA